MIHKAADPPRYHGRCQNFHDKAPPHIRIHHIEEFILPRLIFYKFSKTDKQQKSALLCLQQL